MAWKFPFVKGDLGMAKTKHIEARMSQRAISAQIINIVMQFGIFHANGKTILNRKGAMNLIEAFKRMIELLERIVQKDGVVVVEENGALITAYGLGPKGKR